MPLTEKDMKMLIAQESNQSVVDGIWNTGSTCITFLGEKMISL